MMTFKDKVLLITGGGSGIGKDTAIAFAKLGGRLVLGGRRMEPLNETAEEIRAVGGQAVVRSCDISNSKDVETLVQQAIKEFGQLNYAFNNAGIEGNMLSLHEQDVDEADYLFKVNLNGIFYCMKYEIQVMLENGGGAIVNHSSICGLKGWAGCSLYVASKHGIVGLTKAAALDYAENDIRINAIAPGPIRTPLHVRNTNGEPDSTSKVVPMGRIGEPDEVTQCVLWLLSDQASYVTGQTLPIDGGMNAQ